VAASAAASVVAFAAVQPAEDIPLMAVASAAAPVEKEALQPEVAAWEAVR
jgi:hypothetical protein